MTVLAAVDGETTNDAVVTVADDLAEALGEELVVLHVMPQSKYESLRESDPETRRVTIGDSDRVYSTTNRTDEEYFVDEAVEDAAAVAREVIDGTLEDGSDIQADGRVGKPVVEITDQAENLDASYLVIGGRKRSPTGKALFGSATQSILLDADCPVVTVIDE